MASEECLGGGRCPPTPRADGTATSSSALVVAPRLEQGALILQGDPLGDARDAFELQRLFKQRLAEASGKVALVMQNMHDVQSRLGEQEGRLSTLTQNLEESLEHAEPQQLALSPRLQSEDYDALQDASGAEAEIGRTDEVAGREAQCQLPPLSCSPEVTGSDAEESQALLSTALQASSSPVSASRPELQEMCGALVEELQHVYDLAARGEQASRDVETARLEVEGLCAATAARSLQSAASTLEPQAAQFFHSLRLEFSHALSELRTQVLHLEQRFDEYVTGHIAKIPRELGQLVDSTLQCDTDCKAEVPAGTGPVTHEELDSIVVQIRQDTAELMSEAVERIREDAMRAVGGEPGTPRLTDTAHSDEAVLAAEHLTYGLRQELSSAFEELRGHVSQLAARCDQVSSEATEARRGLDALQEEVSPLQMIKPATQQELEKSSEFLSQELKLMLDMTMHQYHAAARQEIAQVRSELRRELRPLADFGASDNATATRRDVSEAVEHLRQELAPQHQEKNVDQATIHKELMEAMESIMEEVRAEVASGCEKSASQIGDTHRSLATLIEDIGILKARGKVMGEEANFDKEVLEQRLSALQQEHKDALASLRAEVPSLLPLHQAKDTGKELTASEGTTDSTETSTRPSSGSGVTEELAREVADTRRDLSSLQEELLNFTKLLNHDMSELARQASKCENAVTKKEFSEVTWSFQQELTRLAEKASRTELCAGRASPPTADLNCDCEELSILHTSKWVSQPQLTTAIEQLREELRPMAGADVVTRKELSLRLEHLHDELLAMAAPAALQPQAGSDAVSRQELVELVDFLKEEIPRRAAEAASAEVASARRSERSVADASADELAAAHRLFQSLSSDMGVLQASQGTLREEVAKEREALEQRFRIVRQEHALAIEEIRAELPRSGPETERPALRNETFRESQSEGSPERPSTIDLNSSELNIKSAVAIDSPEAKEVLEPSSRDFGTLREDLTMLKSRQEFLKNELRSLVDSASRGAQPPISTSLGIGRSPVAGAGDVASSLKEFAKSAEPVRSSSS